MDQFLTTYNSKIKKTHGLVATELNSKIVNIIFVDWMNNDSKLEKSDQFTQLVPNSNETWLQIPSLIDRQTITTVPQIQYQFAQNQSTIPFFQNLLFTI